MMSQQEFEKRLIVEKLGGNETRLGSRKKETGATVLPDTGPSLIRKHSFVGMIYFDRENPDGADIGQWDLRTNSGQIY